jgi:hypothetical protein
VAYETKGKSTRCLVTVGAASTAKASSEGWRLSLHPNSATRRQSSNGQLRPNPNGWVTWLAHRTASGAPIDSSPSPTVVWWLRAINTPNHLHSNHPSIHHTSFNTRAKCNTPRHKSKPLIQSKSLIQFLCFRTCERIVLVFLCCSCCLVGFLLSIILSLKSL